MNAPPSSSLERYAPLAAGVLFAIPVLVARYPPMTDLPLHEAVVGVLRHYGDTRYFPDGLYHLNLGHPNQLFYLVAWALSYAVGTTWAMKLVVAATEIGLYLSAARLAAYLGTTRWTALLVGLLGYGWMFYWGLLANLIGLAVLLATIPVLDRFVAQPTWRAAAQAFGVLVLLHFAHETAMLSACLMLGLFALGYPLRVRDIALRMLVPAAGFGLAVFEIRWAEHLRPSFNKALPTVFQPLHEKLLATPGVLFAGYEPYVQSGMFLIVIVAIVFFAVERAGARPKIAGTTKRELLVRYRFEIFACTLLVFYLALPLSLNGATYFYQRFFLPAYAILAVVLAPSAGARPRFRLPRFAAAVVPIGSVAIAWPSFADMHNLVTDLDALAEKAEMNSSMVMVDVGAAPLRMFASSTLEGHILASHGGRTLFDFTRSSISPAVMDERYGWNDAYDRMQHKTVFLRPEHELDRFRYLYFHSNTPQFHLVAANALAPDAVPISSRGEWTLFESKRLKYPLLSADVPLPYPRPHTLRKRMKDIVRRQTGEAIPPEIVQEPPPGWTGPKVALPDPQDRDEAPGKPGDPSAP